MNDHHKKSVSLVLRQTRFFLLTLAISSLFVSSAAIAGNPADGLGQYQPPVPGVNTIPELLLKLVDMVFLIMMPIIVVFLVYSGFLFLTAGDSESNISKAKMVFMWTLVGAFVAIGAKVLGMVIQTTIVQVGGG